ncbi:phage holin family protein [Chlorobium sp. N1]|uniref:phage holin family protein n=1 Tax=Chlorobium sp. N1 TaxID=2491138 RepID=UPI00103BE1A8|nr:phage holin family protein [Chlorobium sp. N1]TCD48410.1 phage holin family protein [Chlorobium sp. N1]
MMHILLLWLVNAFAVYLTAQLLAGIHVRSFGAALAVALVLGLVNTLVRPIMILFSIPFILLSLGLFLLIINALLLQLSAALVDGFAIDGFWWAVGGSICISAIAWFLGSLANL